MGKTITTIYVKHTHRRIVVNEKTILNTAVDYFGAIQPTTKICGVYLRALQYTDCI